MGIFQHHRLSIKTKQTLLSALVILVMEAIIIDQYKKYKQSDLNTFVSKSIFILILGIIQRKAVMSIYG